MGDVVGSDILAGVDRLAGRLDEELAAAVDVQLVAHPRARFQQQPPVAVEELRLVGLALEGQLVDHRVPPLDARRIERGGDEPLREASEVGLAGEHIAHLGLNQNRARNGGL